VWDILTKSREKNNFIEVFKYLTEYKFENNLVDHQNHYVILNMNNATKSFDILISLNVLHNYNISRESNKIILIQICI